MKKKLLIFVLLVSAMLIVLPACDVSANSSLKSLTYPYIDEYECTEARLGGEDLLDKYEFIKITLIDKETMEVSFKSKNGKKHCYKGSYSVDSKTRELTGEIGVLGLKFKEKVVIENGEFTIQRNIFMKPLIIKFEAR